MKKFFVIFALFCAMVLMISCGGDSENENQNDEPDTGKTATDEDSADSEPADNDPSDSGHENPDTTSEEPDNEDSGRKQGELYGECYPNATCNKGLICDEENNICIKDPDSGDSDSDVSDSTQDETDSDTVDTTQDHGDTASDNGDTTPDTDSGDSGDTTTDTDSGDSSNTTPDDDSGDSGDTTPDTDSGDSGDTTPDTDSGDSGDTTPDDDTDTDTAETTEEEKCSAAGGRWDSEECTKTTDCPAKPANTEWNDNDANGTYTQTLSDSAWTPVSQTSSYSTTAGVCIYKCDSSHTWENSSCINQRTVDCPFKPETAVWNDNGAKGTYTQTWSSANGWTPASQTSSYSTTAGVCKYKCASGNWDGASCTSQSNPDTITLGNICTGQTSCYKNEEDHSLFPSQTITCPAKPSGTGDDYNLYGQDAQYTSECVTQSFTSSSDVVEDNNTGLTWEKSLSSGEYTWVNRNTHCNELNTSNYGGRNNWRVPNPLELLTIVDNSKYQPATNSNFTGMPTDYYDTYLWTNNEFKDYYMNKAYYFSPYDGAIDHNYLATEGDGLKTNTYRVLCVSGEDMKPAVSSDFTTSSDGKTVTDNRTGLMWQKKYETGKNWQQALQYCKDSIYAGYKDWRLPNKNELASLLNYEKSDAPYSYFPDMPNSSFWSSSTNVGDIDSAWSVTFDYGEVVSRQQFKDSSYNYRYVRCVR